MNWHPTDSRVKNTAWEGCYELASDRLSFVGRGKDMK